MVGYNQIGTKLEMAMSDDSIRAVLLDIDSPGGEVAGCFDLARKIAAYSKRNGGKPIVGAANEQACSAGYALLSGCDETYMPETGIVGSIGVWTLLVDLTRALDKDGIEVTMIRAGERKARGGPYEHADKATVTKLLDWVESTRVQFATLVAENRRISVDRVMATEGDWFHGDDAIEQKLIDGIGPFEAIFARARTLAN
jgi:signal peptide peptidase SppA